MIDTSTRNDNAASDRSVDTAKAQDAAAPEVATAPASAPCASGAPGEVVPIERMSFGSAAVGHLSDGKTCLLYTSPSPRDLSTSRMPSSA